MEPTEALDIMRQMFQMALMTSMPFLLVSMVIGIIIAVFQAATQINEQTLTFVPKLIGIVAMLAILGSTILQQLSDFTKQMFGYIASGV